jgi:hypothetical protein
MPSASSRYRPHHRKPAPRRSAGACARASHGGPVWMWSAGQARLGLALTRCPVVLIWVRSGSPAPSNSWYEGRPEMVACCGRGCGYPPMAIRWCPGPADGPVWPGRGRPGSWALGMAGDKDEVVRLLSEFTCLRLQDIIPWMVAVGDRQSHASVYPPNSARRRGTTDSTATGAELVNLGARRSLAWRPLMPMSGRRIAPPPGASINL